MLRRVMNGGYSTVLRVIPSLIGIYLGFELVVNGNISK